MQELKQQMKKCNKRFPKRKTSTPKREEVATNMSPKFAPAAKNSIESLSPLYNRPTIIESNLKALMMQNQSEAMKISSEYRNAAAFNSEEERISNKSVTDNKDRCLDSPHQEIPTYSNHQEDMATNSSPEHIGSYSSGQKDSTFDGTPVKSEPSTTVRSSSYTSSNASSISPSSRHTETHMPVFGNRLNIAVATD